MDKDFVDAPLLRLRLELPHLARDLLEGFEEQVKSFTVQLDLFVAFLLVHHVLPVSTISSLYSRLSTSLVARCPLRLHPHPDQSPLPGANYSISTAIATASPPPRHNEAMPRFNPRCFRACRRVVRTRAPLAPRGCPRAIPPPFTL